MSIASGHISTAGAATSIRHGASIHLYVLGIALSTLSLLVVPHAGALSELVGATAPEVAPAGVGSSPAEKRSALAAYGELPLAFVPNAGQTDPRVRYYAKGSGYSFFFARDHAVLSFTGSTSRLALRLHFVGASPATELTARQKRTTKVNYLLGRDPAQWRIGLPVFGEVVYREIWPGIDAVFRGSGGKLKYEFHVAPGARVGDIALAYDGAQGLALSRAGDLVVRTKAGSIRDSAPASYQIMDGKRRPVASRYVVRGNRYGFALGRGYDARRPLVIDPALMYSTFLGGDTGNEIALGIAVDRSGNAYIAGNTTSTDFPTTPGAADNTFNGTLDAFVAKLSSDGSTLIYATYLGGAQLDTAPDFSGGIAVGPRGIAYVTGRTGSPDFPTTPGAFDSTFNGLQDAFAAALSPTGSLVYSTFLGGTNVDDGGENAVDQFGSAYVTGETCSPDFRTTPSAADPIFNGNCDAYVLKLSEDGSTLIYSTFLGGTGFDDGQGLDVDTKGHAYATGRTNSPNYPTTAAAFDKTLGSVDAFVTKLSPDGSTLVYSTFLGGSAFDQGFGIAVDDGNAYVTGDVSSADFPTTPGSFDVTLNATNNAFITKLNDEGSALVYSTFLGGTAFDGALGIAVDPAGHAYVVGRASSDNFPTTHDAFDRTRGALFGGSDGYLTKLSVDGSALEYSTYIAASGFDDTQDVAVDSSEHAYLAGRTFSRSDFPTTPGAYDRAMGGPSDGFVMQFETKVAAHLGGGGN